MAIVPLRYPRQRKPQGGGDVQWSAHPWARGVREAALGYRRNQYPFPLNADLVADPRTLTFGSGITFADGLYGREYVFDTHSSSTHFIQSNVDSSGANQWRDFACLFVYRFDGSITDVNEFTLLSSWNAGTSSSATFADTTPDDRQYHAIMLIRFGTEVRVYQDGRQVGSTGTVTASHDNNMLFRYDASANQWEYFAANATGVTTLIGKINTGTADCWVGRIPVGIVWSSRYDLTDSPVPPFDAGPMLTRTPNSWLRLLAPTTRLLNADFIAAGGGRIMGALAGDGGLAGLGGLAGAAGGLAA